MMICWRVAGNHPTLGPQMKNGEDKMGLKDHPTLDPHTKNDEDKMGSGEGVIRPLAPT